MKESPFVEHGHPWRGSPLPQRVTLWGFKTPMEPNQEEEDRAGGEGRAGEWRLRPRVLLQAPP